MALGKGLKALIQEDEKAFVREEQGKLIVELDVNSIIPNKNQPRRIFESNSLAELADSIRQHGVISPILVKKTDEGYLIVAGERRFRASMEAGLKKIPAIIENLEDEKILEIALIENLQREDLNVMEEAVAYQNLMNEAGYTQAQLSEKLGKSRSAVANVLRLNGLTDPVKRLVRGDHLTYGHARALLAVEDPKEQLSLAVSAIDGKLTVRQLEQRVSSLKNGPKPSTPAEDLFTADLKEKLSTFFETPIVLRHKKKNGKIEIPYKSLEDLDRILRKIGISLEDS